MKSIIVKYQNGILLREAFSNKYTDKEIVQTILTESGYILPSRIIKILGKKKERILY